MLQVNDYRVAYGMSEVLHGLDFTLNQNEILVVMGRNGMGKSTLMKSMMGVIPSKSGSVRIEEKDISRLKSHQRVAAGLAYVPQGRWIFSALTVQENIETGLAASGRREVPDDIYELFPVLLEMRSRRGGNLSGGQQQQLAIARALATNPKVLAAGRADRGHTAIDHSRDGPGIEAHSRRARPVDHRLGAGDQFRPGRGGSITGAGERQHRPRGSARAGR